MLAAAPMPKASELISTRRWEQDLVRYKLRQEMGEDEEDEEMWEVWFGGLRPPKRLRRLLVGDGSDWQAGIDS